MPKMTDIMAQIKADQIKKGDRVKYHSNLLFDTLAQTKVSSIEVSFEGCGDSGQIEAVDYTDSKGKGIDEAYLNKTIVKGDVGTRIFKSGGSQSACLHTKCFSRYPRINLGTG